MNTRLDTRTNMDTGERGCVKLSPDYTSCKTIVVWGLLHAVGIGCSQLELPLHLRQADGLRSEGF